MKPNLQAVAGLLERPEILDGGATVRGFAGDQLVTFRLKLRENGSVSVVWTEVSVPAPEGLIVGIRLPTAREEREVQKGLAVAFRTGDSEFDKVFIVDGAPERMVREIIDDEEIRRGVFSLRSPNVFFVKYEVLTQKGAFTLQMPGWVDEADNAALAVRTMAKLGVVAARVMGRTRADAEVGYRGANDPGRRKRDQEEVEEAMRRILVREARRRRGENLGKFLVGALLVVILAGVVAFAIGPEIASRLR